MGPKIISIQGRGQAIFFEFDCGRFWKLFSHKRGQAFNFQLGFGEVIPGWEKGLLGICVGEIRRLTIPPHLGYGATGVGKSRNSPKFVYTNINDDLFQEMCRRMQL